jgi:hypothetical protein
MTVVSAGFAEVDITPATGIPGIGWNQVLATGSHWPPRGRVALFQDSQGSRVAIVALDLTILMPTDAANLRTRLAGRGELPPEHILISCSHTHSNVLLDDEAAILHERRHEPDPDLQAYLEVIQSRLADAVSTAAANLATVTLHYGTTVTRDLIFSRRPMFTGGNVALFGPVWADSFLGFEGPADQELQLLVARHSDGSVAGGLVGFACHPYATAAEPLFSGDFPGALVELLNAHYGGTFLFLQGASGDLHWMDFAREPSWWQYFEANFLHGFPDGPPWNGTDVAQRHADSLFDAAQLAWRGVEPVEGCAVASMSRTLEIAQRWPTQEQMTQADWFLKQDPESVNLPEFRRSVSGNRFQTFYLGSDRSGEYVVEQLYIEQLTRRWDTLQQHGFAPPPAVVEIQVLMLGDVAFVAYPGEPFAELGLRTKAQSPYPKTWVCGVANGYVGYVPTPHAFWHGGYEVRLCSTSYLAPEAADQMTSAALATLNSVARGKA